MPRWKDGAAERLQEAALALFLERGYDQVTVAEIAARAGLTRRSFFNHFDDKREIFFAGAADFQAGVVQSVVEAPASMSALDAAVAALTSAGLELAQFASSGRDVRGIIASSNELQERELSKMASVARAVSGALQDRQVETRSAKLTAGVAVSAFTVAFADWVESPTVDFTDLMHRAVLDLRAALADG